MHAVDVMSACLLPYTLMYVCACVFDVFVHSCAYIARPARHHTVRAVHRPDGRVDVVRAHAARLRHQDAAREYVACVMCVCVWCVMYMCSVCVRVSGVFVSFEPFTGQMD